MSNNGKFIFMSSPAWFLGKFFINMSQLCFCFKFLIVVEIISGQNVTSFGSLRKTDRLLATRADDNSKKQHFICFVLKSPFSLRKEYRCN